MLGVVETFTAEEITGWVDVDSDQPVSVTLLVGELAVAQTWAVESVQRHAAGQVRQFRLRLSDIWRYVADSDRLSVQADDTVLPIAGVGTFLTPGRNGASSVAELRQQLDAGYVFSREGKLQLSKQLDTEWQGRVVGLYRQVADLVDKAFSHPVFVCYSTLLGVTRDDGFIAHDTGFDCAYLSGGTQGPDVAKELQQVAFALVDQGFDVKASPASLRIRHEDFPATEINLFHLFFDNQGALSFPFGAGGDSVVTSTDWQPPAPADFAGGSVLVPQPAERLLDQIYGSGWRVPDPGFRWDAVRTTEATAAQLPPPVVEEIYWTNFYARNSYTHGSTFSEFVLARSDLPTTVLDIGCGEGRDSFAFATAGRHVTGIDRSEVGVRHATQAAARQGFADTARFVACDVNDTARISSIVDDSRAAAGGGPVMFYLRFFLHSIPEDTQHNLLSALRDASTEGDAFAAEFRTAEDADADKVHGGHYRRYQDADAFAASLEREFGFRIVIHQHGNGMSPYRDEDPVLFRAIARRTAA